MPLYQLVSIIGSVLLLTAYAGLQLGYLDAATSYLYQFFNLFGAACLTYSVIKPFNSGVFITELCWTGFSILGVVKLMQMRNARTSATGTGTTEQTTDRVI